MSLWNEKPESFDNEWWRGSNTKHTLYDGEEIDAWLENLHCDYRTLEDYKRWWLELNELLKEYLVDCTDADIIFSQIKDFKEKAEKWDEELSGDSRYMGES